MQKGHFLHFPCQGCQSEISFSLFNIEKKNGLVSCNHCQLTYDFSHEDLARQLRKFAKLCEQIQESEEILSNTAIGVHIGDKEIKIPFKILLSRLNSKLDLMIGDHPLTITFRIEPSKDLPKEII